MKCARMPTPKVRVYPNGKATLSGVTASDLASILTSASLHRYEDRESPEPELTGSAYDDVILVNWQAEVAWHKRQRWIIDRLLAELHRTSAARFYIPLIGTIKQRLADVRDRRRLRHDVERWFEDRRREHEMELLNAENEQ